MKKVLSVILAACLLCTFISSCGKEETNGESPASGESNDPVDSIPADSSSMRTTASAVIIPVSAMR